MTRTVNLEKILWETFITSGYENQLLNIDQRKYVKEAMKRAIIEAIEIVSEEEAREELNRINNTIELVSSHEADFQFD